MNNIIITSGDLKKDYEILGIVSYFIPDTFDDVDWGIRELKMKCEEIGGNAIIHFTQNINSECSVFYGTAVKTNG